MPMMDGFIQLPTKERIPDLIRILNRTYEYPFQWILRRSQKEHVDQFGQAINKGDTYWRMRMGGSYANDLKLSATSMQRFIFVLFAPHPKWELDAVATQQHELQKVREIMEELRAEKKHKR